MRVIPRLDVKGPNVVKGVRLEGLRVIGEPHQLARSYAQAGADEIIFIDTVASLYGRNNLFDVVEQSAGDVFVPLTLGGGIRTLDDIRRALNAGADKVSINTAAVRDPRFIRQAANYFGSQCIVLSIEGREVRKQHWEIFTDNGRECTGIDAVEWAEEMSKEGAGEILVTSVDRDGTRNGYDLELVKAISQQVPIPVIASGGPGTLDHLVDAVHVAGANAIAVASMFHYGTTTITDAKGHLARAGVHVRV